MSPFAIISLSILGILWIVALSGNGFIFTVTVLQWLQKRKMPPCEFLLTCLSASRLLTEFNSMAIYLSRLFYSSSKRAMLLIPWVFLNIATLWCVSWLSIFYCVKIINFSNSLLLWLKLRINLLLPKLLGISMVIFMVSSLPSIFTFFNYKEPCNQTVTPLSNQEADLSMWISFAPLQLTFTCINFIMNIAATLLLLISLWRHVRNLRKSGTSVQDLNTKVHLKVMRPLLITLLFYLLFIANLIVMIIDFFDLQTNLSLIGEIMVSVFPSAHPIILIWTNPKLKEVAAHTAQHQTKSLKKGDGGNRYPPPSSNRDCFYQCAR
nr:PREDICTED: taste receptor type 2 member 104-like [Anolis carolinensis]|eukprot:XP_016852515.1 PREDICTED: taste receptor type 2 member 104-like [Anolis carolinensis]